MKLKSLLLSLAVVAFVFTSCEDGKKKEAEEAAKAEEMRMEMQQDSIMQAEEMAKADFSANTVAAIAMKNADFSTLVTAIQTAELAETLNSEGPFTVFAPTNAAFAKVPKATMDNLMMPENKAKLQALLTYHVVAGEWNAETVMTGVKENNNKYEVTTVQGEKLMLSMEGDKLTIKDAKGGKSTVVMADVDASNGIIHGVDTVLMPKG